MRDHAGGRRRVQPARILPPHRHARQDVVGAEDRARRRNGRQDLVIETRADLRVLHVDGRRRAADRDRFLQRRELHRGVDRDRLPHRHDDALAEERREAGELELQRIGAGVDGRETVEAAFVRHGGWRAHHGGTRQRDGDAGQHAALVVGDFADQFAKRLAGLRRGRRQAERR